MKKSVTKKAKTIDRIIIAVLLVMAVGIAAFSFSVRKRGDAGEAASEVSYRDYNGKKIGILTGTNLEQMSFEYFPDSEYLYFDGYPNMNAALENGMIDAFLGDEPALKSIHAARPGIDYIRERLTDNRYSFAFRKNDPAEKKLRELEERFQKLLECTKLRLEPCVIPEEEQEAKIYMPVEKAQDLMAKNAEFSELVKDLALDIR